MKTLAYDSYKHVHDADTYVAIYMYYKHDTLVVSSDEMVEQLLRNYEVTQLASYNAYGATNAASTVWHSETTLYQCLAYTQQLRAGLI